MLAYKMKTLELLMNPEQKSKKVCKHQSLARRQNTKQPSTREMYMAQISAITRLKIAHQLSKKDSLLLETRVIQTRSIKTYQGS